MKKVHTSNHKLYEEYYLKQAKQKGGSLPVFHGSRFQKGYGLGAVFKGLFRWALPHLKQGAKAVGKKALQTGVNAAQDALAGENLKVAVTKRVKEAINDTVSRNTPRSQIGNGQKAIKRKVQPRKNSSPSGKKRKTNPQKGLHVYFKE